MMKINMKKVLIGGVVAGSIIAHIAQRLSFFDGQHSGLNQWK